MIITRGSLRNFDEVLKINDTCFSGIERPPAETLRQMISGNDLWVAREGDKIIGYAVVNPYAFFKGDCAYLWQIAVDPAYQCRGVGGNILGHLSLHYYKTERKKYMTLHVHPDNSSQKLYFDYGFRVAEIARNFYVGSDGLMMRKIL